MLSKLCISPMCARVPSLAIALTQTRYRHRSGEDEEGVVERDLSSMQMPRQVGVSFKEINIIVE